MAYGFHLAPIPNRSIPRTPRHVEIRIIRDPTWLTFFSFSRVVLECAGRLRYGPTSRDERKESDSLDELVHRAVVIAGLIYKKKHHPFHRLVQVSVRIYILGIPTS